MAVKDGVVIFLASFSFLVTGRCPQGRYGFQCGYSCNCLDEVCNSTYGCRSQTCSRGWSGATCQKYNKALGKSASASSIRFQAGKAVDGITKNTTLYNCFHSEYMNVRFNVVWWRVDLNETTPIHDVTIYFRTDHGLRRNGIQVYIADTDASPTDGVNCYNVTGKGAEIPAVLNVTCSGKGRYLVLYTTTIRTGDPVPILDFCEVKVDVCAPGTFGSDCDNYCHCAGDVCNFVNGVCPSGVCLPGWQHDECDTECTLGSYGQNCSQNCSDRNCKDDNSSCDHATGMCVGGCKPGWNGTDCAQKCTDSYGDGCAYQCSARNCSGTSTCDHVTGKCEHGCNPGWKGGDCTQECTKGVEYGSGCVGNCSARRCDGSTDACPPDTGQCESTCLSGWQGEDCAQEKVVTHTPSQEPVVAAVVGAVVGVVVILLLVFAVILIRRRRRKSHGRSTHKPVAADNVKPPQVAEDIGMYMNVGFENDEKPRLSPVKTSTKQIQVRKQNKSQGDSAGEAVYTTGSMDSGKGGTGDLDHQKVEEEEDYDVSDQRAEVEYKPESPDRSYYNLDDNGGNHVIPVSELKTRVEEMTPASAEEEFKRLPDGFVHSYDESQQPKNKGKNRFRGYYPYDYNRVVLHGVSEDKDKDYINASYLDGYKAKKRYIAAQGPYRPEVMVDFWRMMYQEHSTAIVMVTGLVEAGKVKCLQYWPEKGTSIYGDISVTKGTETQLANYTVTKLSVHNKSEGKTHHVHHFHFTSWPDHGVPDTSALLEFMWRVKATTRHQTQPIIVHCSAGIGRTGTYTAVESLVDQAATEGFVDVVSFVSSMRGQRKNMIQTKEQYLFLYQAVAMAVSEGDTSLDADAIRQIDLSHVSGVTMGNRNAQEHLEALENTPERGLPEDQIIMVASYTSRKGFFITMSQPDKDELWNQMYNSYSRTLITLTAENKIFLPSMDSPVSTSRLTASLQTSKVISNDVILNTIDLTVNGADVTSAIQHYHVTGSTHDSSVTLLIDSLLTWMSDPERGSCTIVSHSVSEARFLVLLVNIASRLQDDSKVDVISNMRRLHSTLGGPPFSQEDVRRCVEFAQRRLESPELYANL